MRLLKIVVEKERKGGKREEKERLEQRQGESERGTEVNGEKND